MAIPDREEAFTLLCEYTKSESLIKHALAVESGMRFYAERYGEDVEVWGVIGLLHDFDYEKFPTAEEHPYKGAEIMRARGYDEWMIETIISHADYTGVARDSQAAKALFAVDELSGLVTAVTLVRPSKQLADVTVKSVKKKMKDKGFAKNVNRDDIKDGAALLEIELGDHIQNVIQAMQAIAPQLGL